MKYIIVVIFLSFSSIVLAQNKLTNFAGITFGQKKLKTKPMAAGNAIDFLGFVNQFSTISNEEYLSADIRKTFGNKSAADITLGLNDGLSPTNLQLRYLNKFSTYFGWSVGFEQYYFYVNQPENSIFPMSAAEIDQFRTRDNSGFIQSSYANRAVYFSPFFFYKRKFFQIESHLNFGVAKFSSNSFALDYVGVESFKLRGFSVKTVSPPALFVRPTVRFALLPLQFKRSALGFYAKAQTGVGNRTINYDRTDYAWLRENATTTRVNLPKRLFQESQLDFGINWHW